MAAQNKLFQRLIWLVDTIYSAGHITRDEIDRRWVHSSYNDEHATEYGERNFHRHKDAVYEMFGIEIVCNRRTKEYSLASLGDAEGGGVRSWLIDTFAINNCVNLAFSNRVAKPDTAPLNPEATDASALPNKHRSASARRGPQMSLDMQDRILFERIPEGTRYLSSIVSAMKEGHQLYVTYKRFDRPEAHSFLLAPYCLKVFKQRWYMVGKPEDHPEEADPRVYALDRVVDICTTDKPYKMPKDFRASKFFEAQFGVDRRITEAEKIRVKVTAAAANYIRTLPIHGSQFELERTDDYSIFGYYVAPTYDFVQELRKHGSYLEVLEPEHLREDFKQESAKLGRMYWD